uniref:OB domain-containing protein n=1 Tax=Polytomella parva TaxID=51329 RepID=A0A7S0UP31_9CHLO|mmetsp:Transcript_12966/g.23066  ORF Transcript_12966/g.23066 Transcript_12966/m.23066 type:complete len:145 (+) Transcript_12966:122-556(+)
MSLDEKKFAFKILLKNLRDVTSLALEKGQRQEFLFPSLNYSFSRIWIQGFVKVKNPAFFVIDDETDSIKVSVKSIPEDIFGAVNVGDYVLVIGLLRQGKLSGFQISAHKVKKQNGGKVRNNLWHKHVDLIHSELCRKDSHGFTK